MATDDVKQKFGGVEGLPTTMLYDRQGVLRMKFIGFERSLAVTPELTHGLQTRYTLLCLD